MEIHLGNRFAPSWAGVPPHMSSGDFPIWQRYLHEHAGEYEAFYYDVYLVPDLVIPDGLAPELVRMWKLNNAKRIDALGVRSDGVEIIEVRVAASAGALGAIQMYLDLWKLAPALSGAVRGTIITDRADPVLFTLTASRGLKIIEA